MTTNAAPPPRTETIRRSIQALLTENEVSALTISATVGIPEKTVYDHLAHLRKSLSREGRKFTVTPPACLDCGFVFTKRSRLSPPGKCPVCRSTHLSDPLFSVA